jgi:hypothetical protein
MRVWSNIIHVAGRPFVKDACSPSVKLEMMISVHFAMQTEITKQKKRRLKK